MTVEQVAQFLDRLPFITTGIVGAVIAVGITFFFMCRLGPTKTLLLCWGSLFACLGAAILWKSPPSWAEVGLYFLFIISVMMAGASCAGVVLYVSVEDARGEKKEN